MEEIEREYRRITELITRPDEQCRLKEIHLWRSLPARPGWLQRPAPLRAREEKHHRPCMARRPRWRTLLPHRRHGTSTSSLDMQVPHRRNPTAQVKVAELMNKWDAAETAAHTVLA